MAEFTAHWSELPMLITVPQAPKVGLASDLAFAALALWEKLTLHLEVMKVLAAPRSVVNHRSPLLNCGWVV